jgi:hypothetical protein
VCCRRGKNDLGGQVRIWCPWGVFVLSCRLFIITSMTRAAVRNGDGQDGQAVGFGSVRSLWTSLDSESKSNSATAAAPFCTRVVRDINLAL